LDYITGKIDGQIIYRI